MTLNGAESPTRKTKFINRLFIYSNIDGHANKIPK